MTDKKTREDIIKEYEEQLERMPEEKRDEVFVSCACGEHTFSPRQVLEAMKDTNNEDGKELIKMALELDEVSIS